MKPEERLKDWKLHDSMRGYFGFELYKQMAKNKDIYLLTGDLGFGLFNNLREDFDRFINVGASEQTMLDMAVGLASCGKIPVVYSITTFLLYRPFETIRTYIDHEKKKVLLIGSGRDKDYAHDGISHWSEDVFKLFDGIHQEGILKNVKPFWPEGKEEIQGVLHDMLKYEGPSFLSLRRQYDMDTITKHAGGRPTKYDPSMVGIAQAYIDRCSREATELPTIEGLALELGLDDERIGEYAQKYPEFHATIKDLKSKQKNQLINDGMYGGKEVNSTMAIFLLKANHGLIETSRTEVTGVDGQPIQYKIITGTGFIPSGVIVDASPEANTLGGQSSIQDGSLAPQGS